MSRQVPKNTKDTLARAQNLVYDAWDANTAKQRIALANMALAISPLCADAYVILAQHAERGSDKELELWRRGVETGKLALGEAAFAKYAGDFWDILATRPYMRARIGLARVLWERGIQNEAIDHFRDILRLNPNDNQGARYGLAALYIEAGRDIDVATLLRAYPNDAASAWSWTAALAAFRRDGDSAESRKLLAQALADNRHVPAYLLGAKPLPKSVPLSFSISSEDEATFYARDFRGGWLYTPGALEWLRAHAPTSQTIKRRPR